LTHTNGRPEFKGIWSNIMKVKKYICFSHAILAIIVTLLILTAGAVYNCTEVYASSEDKAINATVPMSEAAFSYLDEIYTKRFPEMALEPQYGSYKDIEELRVKAAEITTNCSTDKEKAEAIIKWVCNYITYDDNYTFCCYPIDVYHHRVGVCLAYATLSQEMIRLSGIPAVVGDGYYGNMDELTFKQLGDSENLYRHAWIYVYYGNTWHMYDPVIGGANAIKDRSSIGSCYACTCIEGVLPYYEGLDLGTVTCGRSIVIYKNGRFMIYDAMGLGNIGTNFHLVNYMICYRCDISSGPEENCGMYYLNQPGKAEKMQAGDCFYGGWLEDNRGYAMENGIFKAATIGELEGEPYILDTQGFAVKVAREIADNCRLELGVPVFEVGETFRFRPDWCESEIENDRVIVYDWYDRDNSPELGYDGKVDVDKDGNITMLSPGMVAVNVTSRESYDDEGCFQNNTFSLYINKDFADCSIKIEPISDQTYTGDPIAPDVSIYADGEALVRYRDYVLDYSGNIEKGTAKIKITGVGIYKGSLETSFDIIDSPADNPADASEGNDSSDSPSDTPDQSVVDPVNQTDADGPALGEGASAEAAASEIAGMTSDKDLPGTVFSKLQLRSKKQTKSSITLSWKNVPDAKTYVIYGNKCGKNNKLKKLATVKNKDTKSCSKKISKISGKKLKNGTYYKFMIVAIDSSDKVVSSSKIIYVATKGGKVGNVGKVTTKAKRNKVTIKKGKTFKLACKQVAAVKKLKVKPHRPVTYESTNPKIATVTKKGVIKGKKKGTCYVYAYAQNGVFSKIKVTVK